MRAATDHLAQVSRARHGGGALDHAQGAGQRQLLREDVSEQISQRDTCRDATDLGGQFVGLDV